MANNRNPHRNDKWREKIQTSMLINRLYDNALGEIELTASQLKSIEILLKKTIPDLKSIEHRGEGGGPIQQSIVVTYVDSVKPVE